MKEHLELSALTALSPLDGRYQHSTALLRPYFSEYGLIRYRVQIEVEYLLWLSTLGLPQLPPISAPNRAMMRGWYLHFAPSDAQQVKEIEKTTNHDVKAVEYFLKKKLAETSLSGLVEFVHFGLTSQDVNNTAIPLALLHCQQQVLLPQLQHLASSLHSLAMAQLHTPMLARTHGQPASPTTLGKEVLVFAERLNIQLEALEHIPFAAKLGGATGNFNAHHAAYPGIAWHSEADKWVAELGLKRSRHTTQIEHYDHLAAWCDAYKRIATILIDLCRDLWHYISLNYFSQTTKPGEVGSSAMPHKVNPIDFENAEGNLGLAVALLQHLAHKLPISRLQRDLTDSTVLRNLGVPVGHLVLALASIGKGLGKLQVNHAALQADLDANWAVVAEGIQTILRREGVPNPYERLKELTRGQATVTQETLQHFIYGLNVEPSVKAELLALSPHTYTGVVQG